MKILLLVIQFFMELHQENFLLQVNLEKDLLLEIQGAEAVVEGCDSNGCEYMTGGTVLLF